VWEATTVSTNLYQQLIQRIFEERYSGSAAEVPFEREDIVRTAKTLRLRLPKNLGDLIYSFRFRTPMPPAVQNTAPPDYTWSIELAGRGKYRFRLRRAGETDITPNPQIALTKVPDATPGVVAMYALSDEQALLAKVRYNQLIDVFTGVVCYSLQNHLRTTVSGYGQVETDEIYVGIDRRGIHYVIPVQAKGGRDKLSVVQIEQDVAVCQAKFPELVCRPIGAQFMEADLIALFEFERTKTGVMIAAEKHYRLTPPEELTVADLRLYRSRLAE
jgi:hypothetical protein